MVLSRNDRKSSPSVTKKSAVLILDEGGRVLAVACFNSNGTVTYTYDAQNQLLSAVNGTTTYAYTYDTVGNILSGNGHTYTYGDAGWKDLLTAVDGQSITYDAMGNPTSYYNGNRWAFTWAQGRRLTSASDGTNTISYTYDADGLRTSKTVNGVEHTYYYAGGKLLRESFGSNTLDFFYDSNGNAYALKYNGILYYYITNLQGDVMSIVDGQGAVVASYNYDPYGNLISDEPAENTVGHLNPLRYRAYYYDSETGLYYVSSRYYDPEIGRWINADDTAYLGADGTLLSYNLFAYCKNNPVMGYDPTGHFGLVGAIIATGAIVGGLLGAFSAATTGGNILESAIEGCLTGALGAACGILISNPIVAVGLATVGGAAIDFTTQVTTQYIETKSVDMSKIDRGRIVKTGLQTGIGTAIPAFGEGAGNAVDAFGTALIWAEASTMIVCIDVVVTNTIAAVQSSSRSVPKIRHSVAIHEREMLLR